MLAHFHTGLQCKLGECFESQRQLVYERARRTSLANKNMQQNHANRMKRLMKKQSLRQGERMLHHKMSRTEILMAPRLRLRLSVSHRCNFLIHLPSRISSEPCQAQVVKKTTYKKITMPNMFAPYHNIHSNALII